MRPNCSRPKVAHDFLQRSASSAQENSPTLSSDTAPARLGLANALLAQKKYEPASDALAEYLKMNPGDRSAHFDRASALLNLGRFDEALSELDRSDAGSAPSAAAL